MINEQSHCWLQAIPQGPCSTSLRERHGVWSILVGIVWCDRDGAGWCEWFK
jgi:hypothetical protein